MKPSFASSGFLIALVVSASLLVATALVSSNVVAVSDALDAPPPPPSSRCSKIQNPELCKNAKHCALCGGSGGRGNSSSKNQCYDTRTETCCSYPNASTSAASTTTTTKNGGDRGGGANNNNNNNNNNVTVCSSLTQQCCYTNPNQFNPTILPPFCCSKGSVCCGGAYYSMCCGGGPKAKCCPGGAQGFYYCAGPSGCGMPPPVEKKL